MWKRVLTLNFKSKYVNENLFMTEDSLILVVVSLKKFEKSSQCSPNPGVTKSHIFFNEWGDVDNTKSKVYKLI